MAITRAQIEEAVKQYLPRTVNFAKDEDTGLKDRDAIFEKVMRILVTALLLDEDTIFYIVFLAVQRWKTTLETAKSSLVSLQGSDHLRAVREDPPERIEDLSKLEEANRRLTALGGSIGAGQEFGTVHFEAFKEDLTDFLTEQVVPNVAVRNRAAVKKDLVATTTGLSTTWETLLSQREQVFLTLSEFLDQDVRSLAAASVIESISDRIAEILEELESASTTEQAEESETTLVDLVAGQASLEIIGNSPEVEGTVIVGPADDGATPRDYLELTGRARVEPLSFVLKGEGGKLHFDLVFFAETGAAEDDVDGDSVTPTFVDSVQDFDAEGVEEGMFLHIVPTGRSYTIEEVGPGGDNTKLTVSPEIPNNLTATRYIITNEVPGTFFQDPETNAKTFFVRSGVSDIWDGTNTTDTTFLFWDEFSGGETATTRVGSPVITGSAGEFARDVKTDGTGGTNLQTSGSDGEVYTTKVSGLTDGEVDDTVSDQIFNSATATFITSGVEAGDELYILFGTNSPGPYIVDIVLSETALLITGTLDTDTGMTFFVRIPDDHFIDPNATFLTDGIESGDTLRITSNPYIGTYTVDTVESQTRLTLTTSPFTAGDSSISWEFRLGTDEFSDPDAFFFLGGPGDFIDITGEGTFEIVTVDSPTQITVDSSFASPGFDGVTWEIYPAGDTTRILFDATADFVTDEVGPIMDGQFVQLELDGALFNISYVIDEDNLVFQRLAAGTDGATDSGDDTQFSSEDATFLSSIPNTAGIPQFGVAIVIQDVGTFAISSIDSDTELTIATGAGTSLENLRYTIEVVAVAALFEWFFVTGSTTTTFTDTTNSPFGDYDVGDVIVLNPETASEERATILEIVDDDEVVLASAVTADQSGLDYAIISKVKAGMEVIAAGRRSTIVSVVNGTRLQLDPPFPQVIGVDVEYVIVNSGTSGSSRRLVDQTQDFDSSLVGQTVDLMLGRPVKAEILGVADPNDDAANEALDVDTTVPLGRRFVSYRILSAGEGTSLTFETAEDTSSVAVDDVLTVWGISNTFRVSDIAGLPDLGVSPTIAASLTDQDFIVMRGGSKEHGRYLLLEDKNDNVTIDDDIGTLELNVAEVLTDFGSEAEEIITGGAAAEIVEDGDEDDTSFLFRDTTKNFVAAAADFGDRLTVTLDIGGSPTEFITYVTSVSPNVLEVEPELSQETVISWTLERTSVSFALKEADRLQGQIQDMLDVVDAYTAPRNSTLRAVFDVLTDQKMDRAIDLLSDGKIEDFLTMESDDSSYASSARSGIQTVGSSVDTSSVSSNVAGTDPSSDSASTVTDASAATSSSMEGISEEVDVVVALANAVSDITADERAQTVTEISQEELRNRAIYELTGEVESDAISDQDPTLPWIAQTGSKKDKLVKKQEAIEAALDYIIDHPDEFGLEDE